MNPIIEQGVILTPETSQPINALPWRPHASCAGVYLKHLITGAATHGQFSCHLVRVQAGYEIAEHAHPDHWELHEIICGQGSGFLSGSELPYQAGRMVAIAPGEKHQVKAEGEDLYLWAKFVPALI